MGFKDDIFINCFCYRILYVETRNINSLMAKRHCRKTKENNTVLTMVNPSFKTFQPTFFVRH